MQMVRFNRNIYTIFKLIAKDNNKATKSVKPIIAYRRIIFIIIGEETMNKSIIMYSRKLIK